MPKVVSNTTPLIALSRISRLELLKILYQEITIPSGVLEEYERGKNEIGADRVLIDELRGRKFAEFRGLNVTGTIGVLLKAKEKGLVSEVLPLAYELREKGIWIDDELMGYIEEVEEDGT